MANNNAECQLFCSPLEPTGHYTIDSTVRASMFSNPLLPNTTTGFTFLPRENVIKYPANADTLNSLGVNYLRYKNPDFFGNRWIYCFVRSIEYAAPQTAILHIERDVWVTWCDILESGNLGQAFIERERIPKSFDDNNIGGYLLPEPVAVTGYMCGDGEYKYPFWRGRIDENGNKVDEFGAGIVMGMFNIKHDEPQTNKDTKENFNEHGQTDLDGVYYGGIVLGMHSSSLNTALTAFAVLGADIAAVFPIPLSCLDTDHPKQVTYTDEDEVVHPFSVYPILNQSEDTDFKPSKGRNESPWGFTPNNKKLYTYPYLMIQASNCAGTKSEFRYELFDNPANPSFTVKLALGTAPSIVLVPNGYEGRDKNLDTSISNGNIPPMPSNANSYATYMGQNASSLMFSQIKRYMDVVAGTSNNTANWTLEDDFGQFVGSGRDISYNPWRAAYNSGMSEEAQKAQLDDLRGMGNTISNVPSANANASMHQLAVAVYRRFVLPEDAKRIDDFFSRYGYRVDRVGVPNISQRTDYDYIKTRGANVGGAIPVSDKAVINALLDSGLTIWHSGGTYGAFEHH